MPISDVTGKRPPRRPARAPAPRRPRPWLQSLEESQPLSRQDRRRVRPAELVAVVVVAAAVIAFFVWFLLFASGGAGPGTM